MLHAYPLNPAAAETLCSVRTCSADIARDDGATLGERPYCSPHLAAALHNTEIPAVSVDHNLDRFHAVDWEDRVAIADAIQWAKEHGKRVAVYLRVEIEGVTSDE